MWVGNMMNSGVGKGERGKGKSLVRVGNMMNSGVGKGERGGGRERGFATYS